MGVAYGTTASSHMQGKPPKQKQIDQLKQVKNHPWNPGYEAPSPTLERQMYVCENGRQFKSNLSIDRVICPDCKSRDIDIYTEPPVREEVDA